MTNKPSTTNFLKWFDPRHRQAGAWAFILNRITAIGLLVYLAMHLVVLSLLVRSPQAYNQFIALAQSPLVKIGELLVVSAVILHGLNGIRIGLTSFGLGVNQQKTVFYVVSAVSMILIGFFVYIMFFAAH